MQIVANPCVLTTLTCRQNICLADPYNDEEEAWCSVFFDIRWRSVGKSRVVIGNGKFAS